MTGDHIGRAVPGLSQPIGRLRFRCFWDEETRRWYTLNSYVERAEMAQTGAPWEFKPTTLMPLPDPEVMK